MEFQTNKILGGVGALLLLIGCLPFISPGIGIIGLIGFIFVLVALNGFADYYKEKGIFNDALYGFIIFIIGIVITAAVAIFVLVDFLTSLGIDLTNLQSLQSIDWASIMTLDKIMDLVAGGVAALVILFIFCIIGAYFWRKALVLLANKTDVKLFATTGLLLLIGAVLTIILIGFLLLFVAIILLIVAFFSIKTPESKPETPKPEVPKTEPQMTKE